MPLQDLVEYYNDRLGLEHRSSFRPFVLEEGKVSGLFGPIRIDSFFTPLRQTLKPTVIMGHSAQISVAPYKAQHLFANQIETLGDFQKIIYPSGGPNQDVPFWQDWVSFQSGFNRQHRLLRQ